MNTIYYLSIDKDSGKTCHYFLAVKGDRVVNVSDEVASTLGLFLDKSGSVRASRIVITSLTLPDTVFINIGVCYEV